MASSPCNSSKLVMNFIALLCLGSSGIHLFHPKYCSSLLKSHKARIILHGLNSCLLHAFRTTFLWPRSRNAPQQRISSHVLAISYDGHPIPYSLRQWAFYFALALRHLQSLLQTCEDLKGLLKVLRSPYEHKGHFSLSSSKFGTRLIPLLRCPFKSSPSPLGHNMTLELGPQLCKVMLISIGITLATGEFSKHFL